MYVAGAVSAVDNCMCAIMCKAITERFLTSEHV